MSRRLNERGLTEQQEAFARAYIGEAEGCGAEAYRIAYPRSVNWKPNSLHCEASKMLSLPKVAQRITELREAADDASIMGLNEMLQILTRIARVDMSKTVGKKGEIDIEAVRDMGPALAAYGRSYTNNGPTTKVTAHDPVKAIERIARLLGLDAPDRMQVEQVEFNLDLGGGD